MNHKEWRFKALTDIWTGDADRRADRLIPTGLLGSIRWWFEVLVRGLGGKACDPSEKDVRCPDKQGHHCVVCELFGCTGWARKFRMMVLDNQGGVIQKQIKANTEFTIRFIPLRPIRDEEWCLLDCTLRLIADYGAIGGKTVFKPSDEQNWQNFLHHKDFGLIQHLSGPGGCSCKGTLDELRAYVAESRWRRDLSDAPFSWASLQNFWCVKGRYLARQDANTSTFNRVIGRPEPKSRSQGGDSWLAGRRAQQNQPAESKKVFSFKHRQEGRCTFGFVKPDTVSFDEIRRRLTRAWSTPAFQFKTAEDILQELCSSQGSNREGGLT